MTQNNLTSPAWWRPKPPALPPAPTLTPGQIILAAFKVEHLLTQGMLLDLCRQNGANINYPALRSHLDQLQQQGAIVATFTTHIIPGVPVLVYQRAARPALTAHT